MADEEEDKPIPQTAPTPVTIHVPPGDWILTVKANGWTEKHEVVGPETLTVGLVQHD